MQALCHRDVQADDLHDVTAAVADDADADSATVEYARELCTAYLADLSGIDARIEAALDKWSLGRLGSVERNVLRTAVAELASGRTPPKVVLNEAIEIAREFGSGESASFVNGVLDRVWSDSRGED